MGWVLIRSFTVKRDSAIELLCPYSLLQNTHRSVSLLCGCRLALTAMTKYPEAITFFKKALVLDPENDTYKSNLKIAEQKQKEATSPVSEKTLVVCAQAISPSKRIGVLFLCRFSVLSLSFFCFFVSSNTGSTLLLSLPFIPFHKNSYAHPLTQTHTYNH